MVGIGTIIGGITLLVGSIVAYGVYSSRDKITSSVGGIIGGITDSLNTSGQRVANFTENLIPRIEPATIMPNPWNNLFAWATGGNQTTGNYNQWLDTGGNEGRVTNPNPWGLTGTTNPITTYEKKKPLPTPIKTHKPFQAGYYYVNHPGFAQDTQQFWSASFAEQVAGLAGQPSMPDISYIGKNKLSFKGFQLFGKSKNYL